MPTSRSYRCGNWVLLLSLFSSGLLDAQSARRPLRQSDFDAWRSIAVPVLSPDGRYLAYSFMPQEGDGDLVVYDRKTGKERKYPAGALPPPPIRNPEEGNPDAPPLQRNLRIAITGNSRYAVSTTFPARADTDRARKEKKKAEAMPKSGLWIVDLESGEALHREQVKSVQIPSRGGPWVAYLKEAQPEATKSGEAGGEEKVEDAIAAEAESQPPSPTAPGKDGERSAQGKKEYGTELVLRHLPDGAERRFADVLEYFFARDGRTLVFTVSSKKEEENGVFAVTPGTQTPPVPLRSGRGKYLALTWDRSQAKVAFLSDCDDAASRTPHFKAYLWIRGTSSANQAVSEDTPGVPPGMSVSEKGTLAFSRDGEKLYIAVGPPPKVPREEIAESSSEEKVLLDLWTWKDDLVQPMQRIRANQEMNRTYRGIYHLAEKKYVQIADPALRTVSFSDDGRWAIGLDDRPYRRMVDYDGSYSDIYLVDTWTGTRKLSVKQLREGSLGERRGVQWSPDGQFACYYSDRHWHVLGMQDNATRNLTLDLPVAFYNEENDTPETPNSYGQAGWTRDSRSFLAYDRYDVWQLFTDGRPPRNLTEGQGRRTRTSLRVVRLEPAEEEDQERGIDVAKPIFLRGESEETRASGFFRDSFADPEPPRKLLWAERNFRYLGRSRDAEVLLVSASRFDEYPDLHLADLSFQALTRATHAGSQLQPFLWGRGELIRFRNQDGIALQAALYKPADFDPRKKYPLLVYIYEKLSQNVHSFVDPRPGHNINFSLYVSNGYLILAPDIVYTIGSPGQSALKCVLPAVQKAIDLGFVDERSIGIQGHSWGGYQIAYLVTQTRLFRAAEAGAPVGNMTSAYSGIRWGSGLPRQFQYEQSQSRIGPSLYVSPLKYFENSAVFHAAQIETPLMILHNDQDDAVPWTQGIELFLALRRNGKEAYFFNYNGELHGLRRRPDQKDYSLRLQQFFDHFLKGDSRPEWMEKGIPFIEREEEKIRFQQSTGGK